MDEASAARQVAEFISLDQGFGLYIAVVSDRISAEKLLQRIVLDVRALGGSTLHPRVINPYQGQGTWLSGISYDGIVALFRPLLQGGGVAGELVVIDASQANLGDVHEWFLFFNWMNRTRNQLVAKLACPLILLLPRSLYAEFAKQAPDFWSIRRHVVALDDSDEQVRREERASPEAKSAPRRFSSGKDELRARPALERLLISFFSEAEFLRFITGLPGGERIKMSLPGAGVSLATVAHEAVGLLWRRGEIDRKFFEHLLSARPQRASEVRDAAAAWGIEISTGTPPVASPPLERSTRQTLTLAEEAVKRGSLGQAFDYAADVEASVRFGPRSGTDQLLTRTQELRRSLGAPAPPTDEALVILSSFNPDEVVAGRRHELRLYRPADAADHSDWEGYFGGALTDLRARLVSETRSQVQLHARCVLGVAMRAGAVFHRGTAFRVRCSFSNDRTGGVETWELHDGEAPWLPAHSVQSEPDPQEIHLLISVTEDVLPQWHLWHLSHPVPALQISFRPPVELGPAVISGAAHAVAFANAISQQLSLFHAAHPLPVRIALAGPVGLAAAIGRALDTPMPVTIMDFDRVTERYMESFRFTTGT